MQSVPGLSISRLRAIGAARWDALSEGGDMSGDRFLFNAASRLWRGDAIGDVAEYLVEAEIECLGMDSGNGIRERAIDLALAIKAYVVELRGAAEGVAAGA